MPCELHAVSDQRVQGRRAHFRAGFRVVVANVVPTVIVGNHGDYVRAARCRARGEHTEQGLHANGGRGRLVVATRSGSPITQVTKFFEIMA